MILLWGLSGDSPFEAVRTALQDLDAPVVVVDQREVGSAMIDLEVGGGVSGVTGFVQCGGTFVDLEQVSAVYWRTYDVSRLPGLGADAGGGELLRGAWAFEEAMAAWLEVTPAVVLNRPSAMASNGSKPYQCELIRKHGFHVPATLITTDPGAVRAFWTDRGAVIYKSISGVRSIVTPLGVDDNDRLVQVSSCPTQFQQQVPGRDYRVHVVGSEVFACVVTSGAADYRYAGQAGAEAELEVADVPDDVARQCVELTAALSLHLSGIDLRLAPDGRWFCFEVNPSPGFTYYEAHTGLPIADAIARVMVGVGR